MLKRFHDWPTRLDCFIASRRESVAVWGENDCALFACDAVLAMTGADLAAPFRGRYRTELGAARTMRRYLVSQKCPTGRDGVGLIEQFAIAIAHQWNIPTAASPSLAQRGDVVLVPHELGEALGIIGLDGRYALSIGTKGLTANPRSMVLRAWRI